ncbi:MAG: hypothetical protein IKY94_03390 [Lachnospiraceae bacterium]|nr:hypothetical protein [Lachnospiraceae bacterium]
MLTVNEAKNIGIRACIEKIGLEFCKQHADNATSGFSEEDGYVNCFVGVNDKPAKQYNISEVNKLVLTSGEKWPYAARCNVSLINGNVEFYELRRPN